VADGRPNFVEALKEFYCGNWSPLLLEVLACKGCIMGPGVTNSDPLFRRRSRVSNYVLERLSQSSEEEWQRQMDQFANLDLTRHYTAQDHRLPDPSSQEVSIILERMGKHKLEDELNCGTCGYETCREHATAIFRGLAESETCLPYTIDKLRESVQNLAVSKDKLARTQEILVQAEKLASMGQLAAGIAHELNNPLGVVLMYAHLLLEEHSRESEISEDLTLIAAQADRCKKIVSGLLQFARQNRSALQETNLCELVDEALKVLAIPEDIQVKTIHEMQDPVAEMDPDQVTQVINNLVTNACHAMQARGTLTIRTVDEPDEVKFIISDTGAGISKEHLARIFEPFFTTKAPGKGTGLGLAVTFGIIKMHQGQISVTSNADPAAGPTGTSFTVSLPRNAESQESLENQIPEATVQ
jgi:signal transduction histidine kinase